MRTRKGYRDRMAATLEEWSAQIADLQAKARSAGDEQQMGRTRDTGEAVFRDMRLGAERIAAEFRKTYVQAASRFAP
jgi:hypothetical protein